MYNAENVAPERLDKDCLLGSSPPLNQAGFVLTRSAFCKQTMATLSWKGFELKTN